MLPPRAPRGPETNQDAVIRGRPTAFIASEKATTATSMWQCGIAPQIRGWKIRFSPPHSTFQDTTQGYTSGMLSIKTRPRSSSKGTRSSSHRGAASEDAIDVATFPGMLRRPGPRLGSMEHEILWRRCL